MPVSGNYGTPNNPYGDLYSSYWEVQWYTGSDPAHVEGDFWGRSDLTSGDKIATLRFDNGSSVVDIPAFPTSTDPNDASIKKNARVPTPNGLGWMPILEGGGVYSYLGYRHNGARHGVHNSLSAFPDSGVARWEWEQDVTDSWGSKDGTDNTSAGFTTDSQFGTHAKSFDGTDDIVDIPTITEIETAGVGTLATWVKTTEGSATQMMLRTQDSGGNMLYAIYVASGTPSLGVNDGNGDFQAAGSSTNVADGNWHHVCGVLESTTLRIYVDGSEDATQSKASGFQDTPNASAIGATPGGTEVVSGDLDRTDAYDKALSSSEVSDLASTGDI